MVSGSHGYGVFFHLLKHGHHEKDTTSVDGKLDFGGIGWKQNPSFIEKMLARSPLGWWTPPKAIKPHEKTSVCIGYVTYW